MKKLLWESDFFGYPVYSISDIEKSYSIPKDAKLIILNGKKTSEKFEIHDFKCSHCEVKVTFKKPLVLAEKENFSGNIEWSVASIEDIKDCFFLALESGKQSRFNLDKQFKNSEFAKLYFEWVIKSIGGLFDDEVILFKMNSLSCGFVTLKYKPDVAQIGLIAVDPEFQGKGIGKKIMSVVIERAKQKQMKSIDVATQKSNSQAMAFYEKCGFLVKKQEHIFHFWRIDESTEN